MVLDVSRLVPAARPIALAAGEVFLWQTRPWFVGLLAHGSALKGGFIPGCSDMDFQLYLMSEAFSEDGELPPGHLGPIPGAYAVLAGTLPVPEATSDQIRASARAALEALVPIQPALPRALLDSGEGRLQRRARLTCTEVWPALYQLLAVRAADPIAIWNLPKPAAIEHVPANTDLGHTIRAFDTAVRIYYPAEATVDGALTVILRGTDFLRAVKAWWAREGRTGADSAAE